MSQNDLVVGNEGDKYECPRDHTDMDGGILVLDLAGIKRPICLRCLANMLRCCEAVPKQEEAVPDGNQAESEEPSAEEEG